MFLFNKNNALPHSRRSSIDSLVTDPSTATSTSDAWVSQCSDTSSYSELPSPEQRGRVNLGKRASVFNLRSRSNTSTSTASSFVSVTPTMIETENSQEFRYVPGQSFIELPGPKRSLFTRGKRAKRQSGHIFSSLQVEELKEDELGGRRASVLRKQRSDIHQSDTALRDFKHRISSPFDFQHLTHTDRHQFAALEQTSENDLVAEFSAVRASQAPRRNLTGIRADDLHFDNFSSENLTMSGPGAVPETGSRTPPLSPEASLGAPFEESLDNPSRPSMRTSRSVESFSQPGVNPRIHRHTQSANPPPRKTKRQSGVWDNCAPLSPPTLGEKLSTIADETYAAHAVTTPDDSAIHTTTPPFSPDLDIVAEEPDRFISPRPAPCPPVRTQISPRSPFSEYFSFRPNQRSPIARSNSRGSSIASPKTGVQRGHILRPISQMSDTLGSPTFPRKSSIRRSPTVKRKSNTWRVAEESWEDDVDYIYDNALEAECDFDWGCASEDKSKFGGREEPQEEEMVGQDPISIFHSRRELVLNAQEEGPPQNRFFTGAFRPSLLVPSPNSVPELESRSAVSSSTVDTGIRTPLDGLLEQTHPLREADGFDLSPPFLVPTEYKEHTSRDEMYDDILADYESSDRHFPLLDADQSISSSARSSRVRSSKRSSYDSSMMSSGHGSAAWSSPVRRSASSAGSVPELVQSRRARRDFDMMVDQLSEQVAELASLGEDDLDESEDNETTPPGRPSHEQTFFTAEEQEHHVQDLRSSIEGEVRASLELARRGSTHVRSPLSYHKYASSEGAAKLLASPGPTESESSQPSKTRNRAATSSNVRANRQPYLSLFPAPPKRTPLPSPTSPRENTSNTK
ncbi:hypothetical protein K491DRAFT_679858 [Lophiostoma macrostomum CBS 122681]|uniref:CRIB domain-containing protein n=1 Tax=Lophiostoma macrostomum CBS 122681 TaxID=1314788 RepID=A0A6A6T5T2_9PLEO|nr:hypothetical protein K491DRAFT_679858 [Lophiostoma macrostomum CBS 122681]